MEFNHLSRDEFEQTKAGFALRDSAKRFASFKPIDVAQTGNQERRGGRRRLGHDACTVSTIRNAVAFKGEAPNENR